MKKIKTSLDTWSAVFWFAFGVAICYGAFLLGTGNVNDPGSGFIFLWSGAILVILSLTLCTESLRDAPAEQPAAGAIKWPTVICAVAALVLYGFLLEKLGFIITTGLLLSFILYLSGEKKWLAIVAMAAVATLGSVALFEYWLRIKLPRGMFGF